MGFLDRIKNLGSKLRQPKEQEEPEPQLPTITLDATQQEQWPEQLIRKLSLERSFTDFSDEMQEHGKQLALTSKKFTDEQILAAIPERARTVNALHGKEYANQINKLLNNSIFTDLFAFEEEQQEFQQSLEEFKENTGKNASALKEFMNEELNEVQGSVQWLEDTTLKFLQTLDEKHFDSVVKIHDALEGRKGLDEKQAKFKELLTQLQEQLKKTKAKRESLKEKIQEQRKRIKNPVALQALDKLTKLEEELDGIVSKHERTAQDVWKYYEKHKLQPPTEAEHVLHELPKDAGRFLSENAADVKNAFEALGDQLEQEGRGNLGNLITRLHEQSGTAEKDAARVQEILPEQMELKKDILRDVASINIYDQQQFLLRTARDVQEFEAKIAYVREQLDPKQRITLGRQIKDAAITLGATITGEEEEMEYDDAEEELAKSEQVEQDVEAGLKNAEEKIEDIHFTEPEKTEEPETPEENVFVGEPEEKPTETTEEETEEPVPEEAPEEEAAPEAPAEKPTEEPETPKKEPVAEEETAAEEPATEDPEVTEQSESIQPFDEGAASEESKKAEEALSKPIAEPEPVADEPAPETPQEEPAPEVTEEKEQPFEAEPANQEPAPPEPSPAMQEPAEPDAPEPSPAVQEPAGAEDFTAEPTPAEAPDKQAESTEEPTSEISQTPDDDVDIPLESPEDAEKKDERSE